MQINTKESGPIEVAEEDLFQFPQGLYGFEGHTHFAVLKDLQNPENPFMWLQSVSERSVCFAVLDAAALFRDYQPPVPAAIGTLLSINAAEPPRYLVIANLPQADRQLFLNLKCPVVVNPAARLGVQIILEDERYPMRYYLPAREGD
ncbi:flagellar assembly protein FliW [Ethanoligenens sp.]|uniref:flagellar assembly protein FliW n=1 Tax=Ethanoligenens sp. TaxID=2099655 RepID=UPI0039EC4E25